MWLPITFVVREKLIFIIISAFAFPEKTALM